MFNLYPLYLAFHLRVTVWKTSPKALSSVKNPAQDLHTVLHTVNE